MRFKHLRWCIIVCIAWESRIAQPVFANVGGERDDLPPRPDECFRLA